MKKLPSAHLLRHRSWLSGCRDIFSTLREDHLITHLIRSVIMGIKKIEHAM